VPRPFLGLLGGGPRAGGLGKGKIRKYTSVFKSRLPMCLYDFEAFLRSFALHSKNSHEPLHHDYMYQLK